MGVVESQSQFVSHLRSILARIVRGCHPGTLLTHGGFLQRAVGDVGWIVFLVTLQHVSINDIVDMLSALATLLREKMGFFFVLRR